MNNYQWKREEKTQEVERKRDLQADRESRRNTEKDGDWERVGRQRDKQTAGEQNTKQS